MLFNGARAGASAPDHMHFQAVPSGFISDEITERRYSSASTRFTTRVRPSGSGRSSTVPANRCLCAANRPRQQSGLAWKGYTILVNPYPIFRGHLVIAADSHTPRSWSL